MQKYIPLGAGVLVGLGLGFVLGQVFAFGFYGLLGGGLAIYFPNRTERISWLFIGLTLVLFALGAAGVPVAGAAVLGPIVAVLSLWVARLLGRILGSTA